MQKNDPSYAYLVQILREELVPAMGCTEPIAIAYGAAKARAILGRMIKGVENTIENIGRIGQLGMRETDKEIIRIMAGQKD